MLNITLLQKALAESNTSELLQALFEKGGEINEDVDGVFKLVPHKEGLLVEKKSNIIHCVYMGMYWTNYEDDINGVLEVASVELTYDTIHNKLTKANCCGYSVTHEEFNSK